MNVKKFVISYSVLGAAFSLLLACPKTATAQAKHITVAQKEIPIAVRLKMLHKRFTAPKLKRIYWENVQAEDKADGYAERFERNSPEPPTNSRDYRTQIKKWMERRVQVQKTRNAILEREERMLVRKWKITQDDLDCIKGEGFTDNWPMPPEKKKP